MPLNTFIWNNYKQTEKGKETIEIFTEGNSYDLISKFSSSLPIGMDMAANFVDDLTEFWTSPKLPETLTLEKAVEFFKEIIQKGFTLTYEDGEVENYDPKSFDFLQLIL